LKVAVYTIALNESAHAERWANSATDADYRIVADTGSTDDTIELLTKAGVTVHKIAIRPWRFDDARNAAMALIPADVDVCCSMDMDRYLEPGWRPKLEAAWIAETTALYCRTVYRARVDDPTILKGWPTKNFHHRWGYRFKRPVHEALVFTGQKEVSRDCADIVMCEVQDLTKGTRQQYLPLMEVAHKEDPDDSQICFWLAREYMWANRPGESCALLERYLSLPTSTWVDERSEAMRYLARMQADKKMFWLDKARLEAPHRREAWLDLAEELHSTQDWSNLFWACVNGIEKTHRTNSYLDDNHCWGFRLFDLGAIASWHLNAMDRAVEWGQKALALDPDNQRLKNNLDFFLRRREELRADSPRGQSDSNLLNNAARVEHNGSTLKITGNGGMRPYEIGTEGTLHPVYRPLVWTTVYGDDEYFECLRLSLESLVEFGNYRGAVAIFTDRSVGELLKYIPEPLRPHTTVDTLKAANYSARYDIPEHRVSGHCPVLYLDNDVLINRDIEPILAAISTQEGLCVTTEERSYPDLSFKKISTIEDVRRIGNWWGLELLRVDKDCADEIFPLINSGIIGFKDHHTFKLVANLVCQLYRSPKHQNIAKYFGDQPFLNYVLVKTRLGAYAVLRGKCSFIGAWQPPPEEQLGFVHFSWARGRDKHEQMKLYLDRLLSHQGKSAARSK
jgi:hypothetical protein